MQNQMVDCLISFGSNLGDSESLIHEALDVLASHESIRSFAASKLLRTQPVGGPAGQGDFLNGVARFETDLGADEVLKLLLETEKQAGRERRIRWDARTLDLDLLLYGQEIIFDSGQSGEKSDQAKPDFSLIVPHPRMSFRAFVLKPAMEIAADMIHPLTQKSLRSLANEIQTRPNMVTFVGSMLSAKQKEELSNDAERAGYSSNFLDSLAADATTNEPAKLLVAMEDNKFRFTENSKFFSLVHQHAGPLLLLSDPDRATVETELNAAFEALAEF